MPEVKLKKIFRFSAAHYLPNHPKCGKIHGHNYKLEIVVRGKVNEETGMVIDFQELKDIVEKTVILYLDHQFMNNRLKFIPTSENLVLWIYDRLAPEFFFKGLTLEKVVLWETEKNCAIYCAGDKKEPKKEDIL